MKPAEKRVIRAAMLQQRLLHMRPVPATKWVKAERALEKACAALRSVKRRGRK